MGLWLAKYANDEVKTLGRPKSSTTPRQSCQPNSRRPSAKKIEAATRPVTFQFSFRQIFPIHYPSFPHFSTALLRSKCPASFRRRNLPPPLPTTPHRPHPLPPHQPRPAPRTEAPLLLHPIPQTQRKAKATLCASARASAPNRQSPARAIPRARGALQGAAAAAHDALPSLQNTR